MILKDCQIYDLKKSTLDLDVEIDAAKAKAQKAIQEKDQAEVILKELTTKDPSYTRIKARVGKASQELKSAEKVLSKLESEYDQKLMDGKFEILEKVLVDRKVIRGPDYKLKWGSLMWNDRERSSVSRWKDTYGATFVIPKDKVWVVGAAWTGEYFKNSDAVLMKIPLEVYIEKRRRETSKADKQLADQRSELAKEAKKAGTKIYTPEELADLGL
ncbi:MAG: hypothetical protein ACXABY_19090 [Candidatus Thorarchaeota archaeon]|jgi:flagellar biosynthesis chaperone FliJ